MHGSHLFHKSSLCKLWGRQAIASGSELTSTHHLKQLRSQSLYSVLNGKLVNRQIDHICTLCNSFFLFESDIPLWQDLIPSWFNQAWGLEGDHTWAHHFLVVWPWLSYLT